MILNPQRKQLFQVEVRSGDFVCVEEDIPSLFGTVWVSLKGTQSPITLEITQPEALDLIAAFCATTGIKTVEELKEGKHGTN